MSILSLNIWKKKISKFTKWKQIRQDPLDLDALTNSWDDGNVSDRNFC